MEEWARKGGGRSVAHARLEPTFRLCDPTRPNVLSPYERNPTFVTRALTVPSSVIQGDKPRTKSGHGAIARSNFDREEGKGTSRFKFGALLTQARRDASGKGAGNRFGGNSRNGYFERAVENRGTGRN